MERVVEDIKWRKLLASSDIRLSEAMLEEKYDQEIEEHIKERKSFIEECDRAVELLSQYRGGN